LDWNALTPKPCRKPFGIASAPMIPAIAMTVFTYRHAVAVGAALSGSAAFDQAALDLEPHALQGLDAGDAAIDVDRRWRQRQHF
jgi:hypothetical protein